MHLQSACKAGTVLKFNGVEYRLRQDHQDGLTRVTLRFKRPPAAVTLHLKDLLLTAYREIGREKAEFRISQETPLWPLRLGTRHRYSWRTRVGGRDDGGGQGEIRVFSGFDSLQAAGRTWRVVLVVKEQTWRNGRGDRFRSRQNLFYAPALGFFVKEERFLFRNGRTQPPVVLTLKAVAGGKTE